MPQHSMFPGYPRTDGLRLSIVDNAPSLDATWSVVTELRNVDQDWRTLRSDTWEGVMLDWITTAFSETVAAFVFDEGGEDVFRAMRSVNKAARAHRRRHERL